MSDLLSNSRKFKLTPGFQSSPNFTHLHQLKSVGGDLASMPIYTLTTRKGSPDQLELRYAETDQQVTLMKTDLAPFIGTWSDVTETITYGMEGTYDLEIKRVSDDEVLMSYSNASIVNWRPGGAFVRPKWGIYRSLINAQDLRDEMVLFANFSIEELGTSTPIHSPWDDVVDVIYANPVTHELYISGVPKSADWIRLISLDGRGVMEYHLGVETEVNMDVSAIPTGGYILNIIGKNFNQSKLIIIQ